MSLKIYTAYRIREKGDLWPVVRSIQKQGHDNVVSKLKEFCRNVMKNVDPEGPAYKEFYEQVLGNQYLLEQQGEQKLKQYAAETARLSVANETIRQEYRKSATNLRASAFDFDVSLTFREHLGHIYIIPYCSGFMRDVLDFLAKEKGLEDYHYQNQSDPPEDVPPDLWEGRGAVWEHLTEPVPWREGLTLELCSWYIWLSLDIESEMRATIRGQIFDVDAQP